MEWDAEIKGKNTPSDSDRVPWDEEEELTILPPKPPPVIEDLEIQREERNARLRSRALELITQSGGFCLPIAKRRTEFTQEETKLQPELIKGLLRRGHKMILSGASKSGKSFMLVELALSLATGNKWVGFTCKRCKVLYLNLEIDGPSFIKRVDEVSEKMDINVESWDENLKIMNMRGINTTLAEIKDALSGYMLNEEADTGVPFAAVIIDPMYKLSNGEENSARDVGLFCAQIDYVCNETGSCCILAHHHSKGDQGYKSPQDRASGSGVFARDPDCMVDMIELEINKDTYLSMRNWFACRHWIRLLDEKYEGWRDGVSEDDMEQSGALALTYKTLARLSENVIRYMTQNIEADFQIYMKGRVPLRLEFTLREFGPPDPVNCFFQYPVHILDEDGVLAAADPLSHIQGEKKEKIKAVKKSKRLSMYESMVSIISEKGFATIGDLAAAHGQSKRRVRDRMKEVVEETGEFEVVEGGGKEETKIYFKGDLGAEISPD